MNRKFVQYGAGNIGRGFIGQLFSESGYDVQFIDINKDVINALNKDKCYPVNILSNSDEEEVWVENVSGIDGYDTEAVSDAIAKADIMATAVGVNVLPFIVDNLAEGIRKRMKGGNNNPLNIIICENLLDADKLLNKLITQKLNESEKEYFDNYIGLVEASIGRMVPIMTDKMRKGNILRVCVESYCELPVDKDAFIGKIPDVAHLYPYSPFGYYIKRKLFIHNMGHALIAYLGNLMNYEYIWQAVSDPCIKIIAQRAMFESATALNKRFNFPLYDIEEHIYDLLIRFSNRALGDTVLRVGRDTLRKLSANDRLSGAAKFCIEEEIEPIYITIGIAAGLFFDGENDKGAATVRNKLNADGFDSVLKEICGISQNDREYDLIKTYYNQLKREDDILKLLETAESIKEKTLKIKSVI